MAQNHVSILQKQKPDSKILKSEPVLVDFMSVQIQSLHSSSWDTNISASPPPKKKIPEKKLKAVSTTDLI